MSDHKYSSAVNVLQRPCINFILFIIIRTNLLITLKDLDCLSADHANHSHAHLIKIITHKYQEYNTINKVSFVPILNPLWTAGLSSSREWRPWLM